MGGDKADVIHTHRKHDKERRETTGRIPRSERDVQLQAMHKNLCHGEIGNEDAYPETVVAEDANDVERVGQECVDNLGTQLVQRVAVELLFFTEKSAVAMTTLQWIDRALVREAKVLLHHTQMPIAEIADALGFATPSFFVRFFRQQTGSTPLQFRKKQ